MKGESYGSTAWMTIAQGLTPSTIRPHPDAHRPEVPYLDSQGNKRFNSIKRAEEEKVEVYLDMQHFEILI